MMRKEAPSQSIGILGGMGPAASADFYRKLVDIAQHAYGAEQDADFPAMHLYNLPLFGFDETGFANPDAVREQLVKAVRILEGAGSDFIVIACNTVHAFYAEMQNAIRVPIVSIIDAVADTVVDKGYKTVGLLSSESTKKYGLYEAALSSRGVRVLGATETDQRIFNTVIHRVMAGQQGAEEIKLLAAIIQRYEYEGAEAAVLGCTELPLAISQKDVGLPLLDSTDILAKAALARAYDQVRVDKTA